VPSECPKFGATGGHAYWNLDYQQLSALGAGGQ
jgi:hypothetical protein